MKRRNPDWPEDPTGVREAKRALKLPKRGPDDSDRPRVSDRTSAVIFEGQMSIYELLESDAEVDGRASGRMNWRSFAGREFPRVVRDLRLPAAEPVHVTGMNRCPTHQQPLDPKTRLCLDCHTQAWDEIGRRYVAQGTPVTTTPFEERRPTLNASTELAPLEPDETMPTSPPATLFGTTDPHLALERMTDLAKVLVDVVRNQKLAVNISGREYLTAEAWTTLGSLVGVVPVVCWVRQNENGDGYIARVEARTLDGRVVGAAESECARSESKWKTRDSFQLRSMAQTRGVSRALRAPLGMITVLAGYEATPSEEMTVVDGTVEHAMSDDKLPPAARPTEDQVHDVRRLIGRLAELDPETDWAVWSRDIAGVPGAMLTHSGATVLIDRLRTELAQLTSRAEDKAEESSPT